MRKSFFSPLTLLLAVTVLLSACKDDDEKPSNSFSFDGSSLGLKQGFYYDNDILHHNGEATNFHSVEVYFLGPEFKSTEDGIEGEGPVLWLDLTSTSGVVEPGTYTIVGEDDDVAANQIRSAAVTKSYNPDTDDFSDVVSFINSGTVKISKSGDTYTFSFDLKSGSKDVKGNFSGPLSEDI